MEQLPEIQMEILILLLYIKKNYSSIKESTSRGAFFDFTDISH